MKVLVDVRKLIIVDRDDGGYHSGRCLICGRVGWSNTSHTVDNLGVPFGARTRNSKLLGNEIEHKEDCELGRLLSDTGALQRTD
jgi:hypothetical protein